MKCLLRGKKVIDKLVGTGDMFKKTGAPAYNKTENIINIFGNFVLYALCGTCVDNCSEGVIKYSWRYRK
jgi:ferredoxin